MHLSLSSQAFSKALATVARVSERRATRPVLTMVLVEAEEGEISLTATNLEARISCRIPDVAVREPGAVLLPVRKLQAILSALPDQDVTLIARDATRPLLTAARSTYRFSTLPAEDFPEATTLADARPLRLDLGSAHAALQGVGFAVSEDPAKNPALTAVCMERRGSELRFLATDSYRMAAHVVSASADGESIRALLPGGAALELARLLAGKEGEGSVFLAERSLSIALDGIQLTLQLVRGDFPNADPLIGARHQGTIRVGRKILLDAVLRSQLLATQKAVELLADALRLNVRTLASMDSAPEASEEEIDAVVEGPPARLVFNASFVADALQAMHGEECCIDYTPQQPAVTFRDPDFDTARHVICQYRA